MLFRSVMARAIKDIFCRFQTLNGKRVERKGGWDTHGLPIELAVEKVMKLVCEVVNRSTHGVLTDLLNLENP